MFLALIGSIGFYLAALGALPPGAADTAPNSSWQQVSPCDSTDFDAQAERELLERANADRKQEGLPPLKTDAGLARAARAHAAEMAARQQLSHQFSGEPSPSSRITAITPLHLDRIGENVAMAGNVEQAHAALMASPPHRDNLLNPKFNVAGIGAYRQGHMLYVAQDFGESITTYSVQQAQKLTAASVQQLRARARMPRLQLVNDTEIQTSACAMAQADSLKAALPAPGTYVLRYTSMTPETIPPDISKVISQRGLKTFSAGTCYAHTQKYPGGAYWVVLEFY
jgi:uncharacterized protein YkwD